MDNYNDLLFGGGFSTLMELPSVLPHHLSGDIVGGRDYLDILVFNWDIGAIHYILPTLLGGGFFRFFRGLVVILLVFYTVFFFTYFLTQLGSFSARSSSHGSFFIVTYIYSWLFVGDGKLETHEEVLCLLILWPWCVFLVYTHLFYWAGDFHNFAFAEWFLPVVYGLILLSEHLWAFGSYFFIYLNGMAGRSTLLITFIEDLMAVFIMVLRVCLQAIRGLIVGLFHFACREALLNMTRWWSIDEMFSEGYGFSVLGISYAYGLLVLWADFWLAIGSLVALTALMFLQLTFLMVAVWLFCKCWYTSWMPVFPRIPAGSSRVVAFSSTARSL